MKYFWVDYGEPYYDIVESWMDKTTIRWLGLDTEGWKGYYGYCLQDELNHPGENFWCKVILDGDIPFAVISLYLMEDGTLSVSEYAVAPSLRGKGYGSGALRELLAESLTILGHSVNSSGALVLPDNTASQRAFEKAGFRFDHELSDDDAWIYKYQSFS